MAASLAVEDEAQTLGDANDLGRPNDR